MVVAKKSMSTTSFNVILKVRGERKTHKSGSGELLLSNISMLFISSLPVEWQHNFVTARQEYSPTSTHGHCCYSEQRHTQTNQKWKRGREGGKEGKDRKRNVARINGQEEVNSTGDILHA